MLKRLITIIITILCFLGITINADYVHRVNEGDTITKIAKNHGVSIDTLLSNNKYITNPDKLYKGQILVIPGSNKQAYVIRAGDTLYKISSQFGVSVAIIANINNISNYSNLLIDSIIMIPKIYKVKQGDTLYKIAINLEVGLNDLIRENNITNANNINIGQILYVPAILKRQEDLQNIDNYLSPKAKKFPGSFYYKGQEGQRHIALTFDDGPGRVGTDRILNILKRYNIKATFFVSGTSLWEKGDLIKRIIYEGHTIANHTMNHPDLSKISASEVANEVNQLENKIFDITGYRTALIRPPYGNISESDINQLAGMGYKTIIWSVDTNDWRDFDENKVIINTIPDIRDGSIILMHDSLEHTVLPYILPDIIETLLSQGYNFKTVDDMLGVNPYK